MISIGCHLSISKGFESVAEDCLEIGANTFQFFTRNPRGGKAKEIDKQDIEKFREIAQENSFSKIVAHAPYTMNICSAKESVANFSKQMMKDDLARMQYLPENFYNFHPGSHTGQGSEIGIRKICDTLNEILDESIKTTLLLETMAGKGSEIGKNFEEIKQIIDKVELKNKLGVCLDTCHIYDAGYDIVNDMDGVIKEFDNIIGLEKLKAIHLNDSKNPFNSNKDRHENIGKGTLGLKTVSDIVNRAEFKSIPFILETPQENQNGRKAEIELVKSLVLG